MPKHIDTKAPADDADVHDFVMDLFNEGLVPAIVMHDSAVPDFVG
ncbi:hypothetical protein [Nocardia uniformis]|nr:hypothetical protein [Nocardia uniformis]